LFEELRTNGTRTTVRRKPFPKKSGRGGKSKNKPLKKEKKTKPMERKEVAALKKEKKNLGAFLGPGP